MKKAEIKVEVNEPTPRHELFNFMVDDIVCAVDLRDKTIKSEARAFSEKFFNLCIRNFQDFKAI